ncbi:MAG: hypothetical protein ACXVCE_16995, partial [Bacteriovorax sp.]
MKLGPFSPYDVEPVTQLLEAKKIEFEFIVDEARLKKLTEKYSGGGRYFYTGNKVFWIEIAESEFNAISNEMEKYGITAPSD